MQIARSDLEGISVLLTMPIRDGISWPTMQSLMETQAAMFGAGIPFEMKATVDGVNVNTGRSLGVHEALETAHNRIFMIDADMAWKATDFIRLVCLSAKMDVIGGIYCAREDPPKFFIDADLDGMRANEWGCLPFRGFGLGFTIVHRHILEELAEDSPKLKFPGRDKPIAHIFTDGTTEDGSEYQGEDMRFFGRIRARGHAVWIDPTVVLGHVGQKTFTAPLADYLEKVEPAREAA